MSEHTTPAGSEEPTTSGTPASSAPAFPTPDFTSPLPSSPAPPSPAASDATAPAAFAATETYSADLKASSEVPANDSKGSGCLVATSMGFLSYLY